VGSALKRTLGILLAQKSGFPLRRVGSEKRMTLTHLGEQWLDKWMEQNAFVCWAAHLSPWDVENEVMGGIHVPLNIRNNESHPFSTALKALRLGDRLSLKCDGLMPPVNQRWDEFDGSKGA
jgi:hypothetical protein